MSFRLTRANRERIQTAMLRHRFEDGFRALAEEEADLARDVYKDVYRKKDRDIMTSLPNGWMRECSVISAVFGGQYASLRVNGKEYNEPLGLGIEVEFPTFRMPDKHRASSAVKAYSAGHRLAVRYAKHKSKKEGLREEAFRARKQILVVLQSASTSKKLLEIWPECAPFLAPFTPKKAQLPAVPVVELNKALGLPVASTGGDKRK